MNMIDLTCFKEEHPYKEQIGFFSEAQLHNLEGKLPEEVIVFLAQEGECTFNKGFFRTVLPHDYYNILTDWGLDGGNCHVFLQTAFGALFYFFNGKYYGLFPYSGRGGLFTRTFNTLMNIHLAMPLILEESLWINKYKEHQADLPLKTNEVYAFNPTIPEGGSPETSSLQVANMEDHLAKLAELYQHKLTD